MGHIHFYYRHFDKGAIHLECNKALDKLRSSRFFIGKIIFVKALGQWRFLNNPKSQWSKWAKNIFPLQELAVQSKEEASGRMGIS